MLRFWAHSGKGLAVAAFLAVPNLSCFALDQPTGAPLVLSSIETEQPIPLAVLSPDGKTASCVMVRLHWSPQANVGPNDDATGFTLDIPADSPGASIFTAQLWNASLASALAWQQPWEGARWKILDTPVTDGTGIDAALAVGMIATSARRPYPKDTAVLGGLRPDGTLGAVTQLAARLDAVAAAGVTRVIIPSVQRFDVDDSGQVLNMVRHAEDLHLTCVPVDNLVEATEEVMHDPLPEMTLSASAPKYSDDVASYIDDFAKREETEMNSGLAFAPKDSDLGNFSSSLGATWKSVYADAEAAQQAYRAGEVYTAYRLFARANGMMHGLNALSGQSAISFDVRQALADADDLRRRAHDLLNPPSIDQDDLESALVVAEMADWAYDITAEIEGAQLVTKQSYSRRSDATAAEKDRARQAILFANAEARYLLDGADFYTGLLSHVAIHPLPVDTNAANLLPQLIPAQLATAEIFTEGIRSRANELRDGLLFDPRLAAYINVLRETQNAWETRQHKKVLDAAAPAPNTTADATKLDASSSANVGFDPGNTYAPPHTVLVPSTVTKKLSDVAACLIWANNDCEIAVLDEKYLHLNGAVDPVTHEWHLKDRAKLDALLQSAEGGARQGITFAERAEVDTSVLDMIFERASQLRLAEDDASGLDALRNYWRCALLGNMCWQLAHTRKAVPVDLAADKTDKTKKTGEKTADDNAKNKDATTGKPADKSATTDSAKPPDETKTADAAKAAESANTNAVATPPPSEPPPPVPVAADATTNVGAMPPDTNVAVEPASPPLTNIAVALPATNADSPPPRALPVTDDATTNSAPPAPAPAPPEPPAPRAIPVTTVSDDSSIPVAPVANAKDYSGEDSSPTTNAPAANPPAPNTPPPPAPGDKAATGE
jgi:hypothetical protein